MASVDEGPWTVEASERVYGLQVILLKRVYVLPWSQFLYAAGTGEEVQAVFSTHDVVVKGSNLSSLLSDLAAQHITILREPTRADKFTDALGPRITELQVRQVQNDALE